MRRGKEISRIFALLCILALLLAGCGAGLSPSSTDRPPAQTQTDPLSSRPEKEPKPQKMPEASEQPVEQSVLPEEEVLAEEEVVEYRGLIVIDPGHQLNGDSTPEPIGPGASEEKARVSSGTRGSFTGYAEHELNLAVALLLRDELTLRGYEVYLTRETADVNLSNRERADIANELGADAFIRIHANGSEDPSRHGAMTICPTPDNPYCPEIYEESRAFSDAVLTAFCAATGAEPETIWETDTMSGINYCRVPVTILEMGYMTNQEEDILLSDPTYQQLAALGIADGIDAFLGGYHEE